MDVYYLPHLELLETKGIVTRTTLMGSDMAYYEITPHSHRHYAVCTNCGTMIPLHTCPVVEIPKELSDAGFTVTEHHLEIAGFCKKCNGKTNIHTQTKDVTFKVTSFYFNIFCITLFSFHQLQHQWSYNEMLLR